METKSKEIRAKKAKFRDKRNDLTNFITGDSLKAMKKIFSEEITKQEREELTLNWFATVSNTKMYNIFQKILLPMSIHSKGSYRISFELKRKTGANYIVRVKTWEYNQSSELDTKFLSMPVGKQTKIQFFGKKAQNIAAGDKREQEPLGYNPIRRYLAKYVTNRLKHLNKAINKLKGESE
jgi:hypothetical protein